MARRILKTPPTANGASTNQSAVDEAEALLNASDGSYELDGKLAEETTPEPPKRVPAPSSAKGGGFSPPPSNVVGKSDTVQMVTVTWGREVRTPRQYHTVEIGPFSHTGPVLPGETPTQAMERMLTELEEFAEGARDRKIRQFETSLGGK